jgi:hypothetical protein
LHSNVFKAGEIVYGCFSEIGGQGHENALEVELECFLSEGEVDSWVFYQLLNIVLNHFIVEGVIALLSSRGPFSWTTSHNLS